MLCAHPGGVYNQVPGLMPDARHDLHVMVSHKLRMFAYSDAKTDSEIDKEQPRKSGLPVNSCRSAYRFG